MPRTGFKGSLSGPRVDVMVDMGNPFLNLTVDGFLKIGTVAAAKAAVEETYDIVKKGSISQHKLEHSIATADQCCSIDNLKPHTLATKLTYVNDNYFGVEVLQKLKKMCKEGAYWGTIAGVYVGMEYGMERVRGTRDWKNAMLGGALTGALVSAASNGNRDKIITDAIAGGAIATAAEILSYL